MVGRLPTSAAKQPALHVVGMVGMLGLNKLYGANQARRPSLVVRLPTIASNHAPGVRA